MASQLWNGTSCGMPRPKVRNPGRAGDNWDVRPWLCHCGKAGIDNSSALRGEKNILAITVEVTLYNNFPNLQH